MASVLRLGLQAACRWKVWCFLFVMSSNNLCHEYKPLGVSAAVLYAAKKSITVIAGLWQQCCRLGGVTSHCPPWNIYPLWCSLSSKFDQYFSICAQLSILSTGVELRQLECAHWWLRRRLLCCRVFKTDDRCLSELCQTGEHVRHLYSAEVKWFFCQWN